MNTQWMIDTHGNPLEAVRNFIGTIWSLSDLDGMLVPINGTKDAATKPSLINDPELLKEVNPFKPLMTLNAARLIPELLEEHPEDRLGALLRPCEMRALIEMVKHDSFEIDNFLTISVDCLGTFTAEEYKWRAERKGAADGLTQEALQFARQGGIVAYRFRSACQTCESLEANGADLNINILGLPVRQRILVNARDADTAERFQLNAIADGEADSALSAQHDRVASRLSEQHRRTMERVTQGLMEVLPKDVDAVVEQFESCGTCQGCMNVCPICAVSFPGRGGDGRYVREDVARWLISCAGCGMCEQACLKHLPLSIIFGHIRAKLAEEWGYIPGRSLDDPLPMM